MNDHHCPDCHAPRPREGRCAECAARALRESVDDVTEVEALRAEVEVLRAEVEALRASALTLDDVRRYLRASKVAR